MFDSIKSRLLSLIFIYLLLVIIVVNILIYSFYSKEINNRSELLFRERIGNAIGQLDNVIYRMDTLSTQLLASNALQEMFFNANKAEYTGMNYFEHNLDQKKIAHDILWSFNSPKTQVENVSIFNDSTYLGLRYSPSVPHIQQMARVDRWDVTEERGYSILPPHDDYWGDLGENQVFSLVRPFISTNFGFIILGTIEVMESYDEIRRIFQIAESGNQFDFIVIDAEENLMFSGLEIPSNTTDTVRSFIQGKTESEIVSVDFNGTEYKMAYRSLDSIGWRVLLLQPAKQFSQPLTTLLWQLIGLILLITAVVFFVLILIVSKVTKPLAQLIDDIDQFDLHEDPIIHKCDIGEVQTIQQTFLRLVARLRDSADKLLVANETELNLRLLTLQAKINPHFLFNSLMAISAVAGEEGNTKVPIMCYQLSELFRYTSSSNEEQTTLSDELANIRTYMDFMTWRYESLFRFSIEIEGDPDLIVLPRLILQPLIENAFTHGFKTTYPPYIIRVTCEITNSSWHFTMVDNGGGFTQPMLKELQKDFKTIDTIIASKEHYDGLKSHDKALVNIYIRLRLLYREDFLFHIGNNKTGSGAFIEIIVREHQHLSSYRRITHD